ncbi:MAG: hypothetical protein QM831_31710 [Kofleriaceae bacterium]
MRTLLFLLLATTANAAPPEIFAPGVISGPANDGSPTFSPDGNTLLFTRSAARWSVILESHRDAKGVWSEPVVPSFSGEWPDSSPGFSPDGKFVVFVSTRRDGTTAKSNLYKATRTATGWSAPERLPDAVNIGPSIWKPSIGTDGTIYFVAIDDKGGKRLWSAAKKGDAYQAAQPLSFSDGKLGDVDPEIAPDNSFLVFSSSGRTKDDPKDHLFVVRKTKDGAWGPVTPVHYEGDDGSSTDQEPHLSQKKLYFASDRAAVVHFPRTHDQAVSDVKRLNAWDNSNLNVWVMPFS